MSITRWEPFRDLISLREAMDRLFEEGCVWPRAGWRLPLQETLAIDITITGNTLTIAGETKAEEKVEEESYVRRERRYGRFSRSITLPSGAQGEKAEATFEHGLLTLTIPKAEQAKPKVIKVKSK